MKKMKFTITTIDRKIADAFNRAFSEEETEDGGPGSGNWGHKGRPGKRGGSGQGGGKKYRSQKEDGTYERKKLDDPTEMAGKYTNGKRSAFQGGHGHKFMPKGKAPAPKANHDESNRKIYENITRADSGLDGYNLKYDAFRFLEKPSGGFNRGVQHLDAGEIMSAEHEMVDSLHEEPLKKYTLHFANSFLDGKKDLMGSEYRPDKQFINKEYKNLSSEEASRFESIVGDFYKKYLKSMYGEPTMNEILNSGVSTRREMYSNANQVVRQLCARDRAGGLNGIPEDERNKLQEFIQLKAKMLDCPDVETEEERKTRKENDLKHFNEKEEELRKETEERERKKEEEQKAKNAAVAGKVSTYKKNAESARKTLANAKSFDDVHKAVREFGFVLPENSVDLTSFPDVNSAKAFVSSLDELAKKIPISVSAIGSISGNENRKNTYASCSMLTGDLNIGPVMKTRNEEQIQSSYKNDVSKNWHPQGTIPPGGTAAVITHEMGHAMEGYLSRQMGISLFGENLSKQLRRSVMKKLKMTIKRDVGPNLSNYATENEREWFAEAFAEAYLSPNPRPIAKEFRVQLEQRMREAGIDFN